MAAALSRTVSRMGKAYQLLNYHYVGRQFRSLPSVSPSPTIDSWSLRIGSITPPVNLVPPMSIGQRFMFSSGQTASPAATASSESAKIVEGAKPDGGEKSGGSEQSGEAGKSVRGGPVSWLSFILLALTGAGIIYYYDNEKKKHIEEINKNSIAVKEGPSAGKAAIGGPFSLVNHEGKKVTEKDFIGKWTVMYFGFTHCPDICPEELQKLVSAVEKIKKKAGFEIVPVFISVDPERDTVDQVREYVKEYHPNLVGLTGTPSDIKNVARAYRVYYMKTAEEDYLVDHSIVMYLMGPDMQFVKFFGKNHDDESLTDGIINEIKRYKAGGVKMSAAKP